MQTSLYSRSERLPLADVSFEQALSMTRRSQKMVEVIPIATFVQDSYLFPLPLLLAKFRHQRNPNFTDVQRISTRPDAEQKNRLASDHPLFQRSRRRSNVWSNRSRSVGPGRKSSERKRTLVSGPFTLTATTCEACSTTTPTCGNALQVLATDHCPPTNFAVIQSAISATTDVAFCPTNSTYDSS